MKILIIGGTGLISTGIVKALEGRGASVTVFNRGRTENLLGGGVARLAGDRDDFPAFENAMRSSGTWDAVIDMICFRPAQAESDLRAFAGRCGHFIFCSTVCTYGNTQAVIPTTEDTPQNPHSAYGRDKLACERVFLRATADGALKATIFRPAHTYGPGGIVINSTGWAATFVDRLRKGLPVIVSGDGHGLWQSAYSEDVGVGFAHAAGRDKCVGRAYNIVGGEVVTWDEYTRRTAAAIGAPEPRIVHLPTDFLLSVDPVRYAPLAEILRFHAVYSNARINGDIPEYVPAMPYAEGVRRTVAWMDRRGTIADAGSDPADDRTIGAWERFSAGAGAGS